MPSYDTGALDDFAVVTMKSLKNPALVGDCPPYISYFRPTGVQADNITWFGSLYIKGKKSAK